MVGFLDTSTLLTLLLSLSALSGVGAIAFALIKRDQSANRLKTIADRRRQLATQALDSARAKGRIQPRKAKKSPLVELTEKLMLVQADTLNDLKKKMTAAGWRDSSAPGKYIAATIGLPIVLGFLGIIWSGAPALASSHLLKLLLPIGMAITGFMLPRILLANAIEKRRSAISKAFPDALDLVVICVEAGLSSEAAFNRVTNEMAVSAPQIAEELGLLAAELAFLPDRRIALENLAERTGLAPLRSLSTTLLQSEKYGTPVALGIRVLSQENREARMAAAEKKAASLPAKLTVPMILFFLPVLFMVIAGPAGIRISSGG